MNLDEFYKLGIMFRRYRKYSWLRNLTKKEWAPPGRYDDSVRGEIIRRMPLGVMVVSASGRISMANPAAAELLGTELQDIEGSNYLAFFMADEKNAEFADLVIRAVEDKEKTHEAVVSYCAAGESFPLRVKSSFMEDEDCRMGICLMISKA